MVTNGMPMGPSGFEPVERRLMSQAYVGFALHVAYHVLAEKSLQYEEPGEFVAGFLNSFREMFAPQMKAAVEGMLGAGALDAEALVEQVLSGILTDVMEVVEVVEGMEKGLDEEGGG